MVVKYSWPHVKHKKMHYFELVLQYRKCLDENGN